MTVSSGFFNSINHDRLYDAEQLSSIFDGIVVDGIYENFGEAFNVTAYPDANNTVLVGTGRAWFNHTWTLNDSRFSITLDPPNEMLGRIDAIVIDVNKERDTRKNSIIYLRGDEATPDFPPTLINTENHHQYPIAYITRHAEQNGPIKQSDIEITVGTGACPIATGVLEAQNLENLMQQLDAEFNEWWDGIKDVLDENVATNLQNQINAINEKLNGDTALVGLLEKPIAEAFMSGDYGLNVTSYPVSITTPEVENHNTISFLPNGEVCSITISNPTGYDQIHNININLVNTSGVSKTSTHQVSGTAMQSFNNSWTGGGYTRRGYALISTATLIRADIESYPVIFTYLAMRIDVQSSGRSIKNTLITVKISSAGTVQIEYSDAFNPAEPFPGTLQLARHPQLVICRPANSVKLDDNSYVVPMPFYSTQHYTEEDIFSVPARLVAKVSEDLAIIQSSWEAPDSSSISEYGYAALTYIPWQLLSSDHTKLIAYLGYDSTNPSNVGKDFGARYIVNTETLKMTDVADATSSYPLPSRFEYDVSYGTQTYTLSEKNGVVASKINAGDPPDVVTSKKSNYFLGATNLCEPLPEGTYIAANEDDRLYGIASSGEQVAIGTNGGAAILKTKKTVSNTIDISKSVLWLKGYINTSEFTAYLMINHNPDRLLSYDSSDMNHDYHMNDRSGFVVKISKGV